MHWGPVHWQPSGLQGLDCSCSVRGDILLFTFPNSFFFCLFAWVDIPGPQRFCLSERFIWSGSWSPQISPYGWNICVRGFSLKTFSSDYYPCGGAHCLCRHHCQRLTRHILIYFYSLLPPSVT